jgi:uncharacterized protein YkwD
LHSIRNASAAHRAPFESLISKLRANRAATRISIAAVSLAVIFAFSQQGISHAGPEPTVASSTSILPINVGVGIPTTNPISLAFDHPMDRASVEAGLSIVPQIAVTYEWTNGDRELQVAPERRWMTDARYLLVLPGSTQQRDGSRIARPIRVSFTTQTAPTVTNFQLRYVASDAAATAEPTQVEQQLPQQADAQQPIASSVPPDPSLPPDTAKGVSSRTSITIGFSAAMNADDVARNFAVTPKVAGDLSWVGNSLTFTPSERLQPDARYAISLAGAHDRLGNPLGGDTSFSFSTIAGAQLVKVSPKSSERDVSGRQVQLWFSEPMQAEATANAFRLTDLTAKTRVAGTVTWNDEHTQLSFQASKALTRGHSFEISTGTGAVDVDGNPVLVKTTFKTEAPPAARAEPRTISTSTRSRPAPAAAAPSSSLAGYALNQVNAARSAYGFAPLSLSGQVSSVSQAYANVMLQTGHFSHTGPDGSTRESRLRAGGVSFGYSGENICYRAGLSVSATLDWCHSQFMSEPYPGVFNHIANILSPNFHRLGVGIASDGYRVYVVWDFVD